MIASVEELRATVRSWADASTNRRILSAVVVAVMTTVVRLFGMLSLAVRVRYAVSFAYSQCTSHSRWLRALEAAGQAR